LSSYLENFRQFQKKKKPREPKEYDTLQTSIIGAKHFTDLLALDTN